MEPRPFETWSRNYIFNKNLLQSVWKDARKKKIIGWSWSQNKGHMWSQSRKYSGSQHWIKFKVPVKKLKRLWRIWHFFTCIWLSCFKAGKTLATIHDVGIPENSVMYPQAFIRNPVFVQVIRSQMHFDCTYPSFEFGSALWEASWNRIRIITKSEIRNSSKI